MNELPQFSIPEGSSDLLSNEDMNVKDDCDFDSPRPKIRILRKSRVWFKFTLGSFTVRYS